MAMGFRKLKRSLDLESLNERPIKRQCRKPYVKSEGKSPSLGGNIDGSDSQIPNNLTKMNAEQSPFFESTLFKMSPDKVANILCNEIKGLKKRKRLSNTFSGYEQMQDSESNGFEMETKKPHLMSDSKENELFTFKQVQSICEDMIKDREEKLRECYESVLTNKLAEQYDVFVKFTHDQIYRTYEATPSYLS